LAAHFVAQAARRLKVETPRITERDAELLKSYDWPGNVRELQNAAERAVILARGGMLRFEVPVAREAQAAVPSGPSSGNRADWLTENELRELERENLARVLREAKGRIHGKGGAARLLGVKPTTLASRIKKLGLSKQG